MYIENFKVKYKRPTKLTERSGEYTREEREKLLATPDNFLTGREFDFLLGILPAGTYEETVYFLPLAFQYINKSSIPDLDIIVPLTSFTSRNSERLRKDNLLDHTRNCITELFTTWTSKFVVIHLDEAACKVRGYGVKHADWVESAQAVEMLIGNLISNRTHQDLAEAFVFELASSDATPI